VVYHQARGLDLSRRFGQLELDSLKFRYRLSERRPLFRVRCAVIPTPLRETDHLCANPDPALIQGFDSDFVAFANLAEDAGFGNAAIFQNQFAGARRANTEFVFLLANGKSGKIALDEECSDSFVSLFGVQIGENDKEARFRCIRDPELPAVENKMIALI